VRESARSLSLYGREGGESSALIKFQYFLMPAEEASMNQVIRQKSSSKKTPKVAAPAASLTTKTAAFAQGHPPRTAPSEDSLDEEPVATGDQPPGFPHIQLKSRGWTIGNSANLVEGTEDEPVWATVAWILIPLLIFGLLFAVII
jgi:hypothetical protein